jgi:uncharacterized membrane protein
VAANGALSISFNRKAAMIAIWREHKVFFGIIILACIVRVMFLTSQSLWYDEGWSLFYSDGGSLHEIIVKLHATASSERFQPLYFVLLFVWRLIFGTSEFTLRIFSVLLFIAGISIGYVMIKSLWGKKAALFFVSFLSISSFAIIYSQEVRPYALMFSSSMLQVYCIVSVMGNRNKIISQNHLFLAIATCLNIAVSVFGFLFTLALCAAQLLEEKNIRRCLTTWVLPFLFSLPVLYSYATSSVGQGARAVVSYLHQPLLYNVMYSFYGICVGYSYGPSSEELRALNKLGLLVKYLPELGFLAVILLGLLGCFLLVFVKRKRTVGSNSFIVFFITIAVVFTVLIVLFAYKFNFSLQPRHCIYLLLPLTVLLTICWMPVQEKILGVSITMVCRIFIVLFIAINVYSVCNYYFNAKYARDDYRSVAGYLKQQAAIPSIMLWGMPQLLTFYHAPPIIDGTQKECSEILQEVHHRISSNGNVIVVINRDFYFAKMHTFDSVVTQNYSSQRTTYKYFSLYKLENKKKPVSQR